MKQEILPVVHIGMPKTATKTLQWRLFAGHEAIFYLGRYDGSVFGGQYRPFRACRDELVFKVMDQVAYRGIHSPDMAYCRSAMDDYLKAPMQQGLVPVWSWESYCTDNAHNRRVRARNLKQLFGKAKIVVSVRHPVKLLKSAYMQQLRRDNIGGRYRKGRNGFYRAIDEWVRADVANDITDHLEYPETIGMYVDEFGADNVCVLPFELLVADSRAFYERLCRFMGIDLERALELLGENVDNSRWTEVQLKILERINGSRLQKLKFRFASKRERKQMLDLDQKGKPLGDAPKASPAMSPDVMRDVVERTRAGNEWLERTFTLGLQGYGYFEP